MLHLVNFALLLISCAVLVSSLPSVSHTKKHQVASDSSRWESRAQMIAREELTHWRSSLGDSECARGLCGNMPDYPIEAVKMLLEKNPGIFKLMDTAPQETEDDEDVSVRSGAFEGESMCKTEEQIIYPQYGKSVNDDVERIIVNLPGQLTQRVHTYRCRRSGRDNRCLYSDRLGFETYCEQKTIVQKLLTVSPNGQDVEMGDFEVPSACVCKIKVRN